MLVCSEDFFFRDDFYPFFRYYGYGSKKQKRSNGES